MKRTTRASFPLLILAWIASPPVDAKDYYIRAPRSLADVSALTLKPGDRVLFKGGETFVGNLNLRVPSGGNAARPIEIGSYGLGRPTLRSERGDAIFASNVSGLTIRNLTIAGSKNPSNPQALGNGIRIACTDPQRAPTRIRIADVEVYGFKTDARGGHPSRAGNGILIDAEGKGKGVKDLKIERTNVHHLDYAGITTYSNSGNRHENISILNSEAHHNPGISGLSRDHTGSGIILGSVNGALIQGNRAHDNGKNSESEGGPVGIWAWESKGVVIRKNTAYRNRTGSKADGGAFDFDGGVTDSILEDNLSFDNDGAGYLLSSYEGSQPVRGVTIRNNISIGDGRKNGYGAIHVWGNVRDSSFEGNQIYAAPADGQGMPWAVKLHEWTGEGLTFKNNRFDLGPRTGLFYLGADQGLSFSGNRVGVCGSGDRPSLTNGGTFDTPQAWHSHWKEGTGQDAFSLESGVAPIPHKGRASEIYRFCTPGSKNSLADLLGALSICQE